MRLLPKQDSKLLIAALVLAAITYFYVNRTIQQSANSMKDPSYRLIKLTAKSVPVKVRFTSAPAEGYRYVPERVSVNPARITVIAPEALLEETSSAETAIMDISQYTRKVVKVVPIESVAGIHLAGEPHLVEVTVPIEKIEVQS